jgi:uncharacterized protein YdeI (YjbR/CyaY-like superfamily)
VAYSDAVEEALCFGWIDGIMKKIDANCFAQRFSPRRSAKSQLSETNKERVRRLIRAGLMTPAGMEKIRGRMSEKFILPPDIVAALKRDPQTWKNFQRFPKWYQRDRVGWLDMSRDNAEVFEARLPYFLKMTGQNKHYGQVNDAAIKERRFTNCRQRTAAKAAVPSLSLRHVTLVQLFAPCLN